MKTNDFSYFIERYISSEMGVDEKVWFEKELDGNLDLKKELVLRQKAESIIKSSDIMDLRAKLKSIEKSRESVKTVPKTVRPRLAKYAATVGGVLIISSVLLISNRDLNKEALYNKYYSPYESVSATRSLTPVASSLYSEAINYYNNEDYKKAAESLEALLSNDQGNMEYRFQLANSYMGMESYPEAGNSYLKVIADDNNLFIEDAQWYLGLCYVMTDDNEKAIKQMNLIAASESRYKKEAKKILRKIE